MAVKIGPVIGIDGEKDFRDSIKNMIQQGKTLAAEMDNVTTAFKNADDKESAYAKVSKKLSEQIENQEKIVDAFRSAVERSTDETGENSDTTLKWKEQLAKAETELEKLKGTELDAGDATDEMGDNVEEVGDNMDKARGKTSTFGDVLKANLTSQAIIDGIKSLASAVKEVADNIKEAVTGTVEWADNLATLSTETGISTDQLQKMEYMAGLIDTDVSTITGSMTKMTTKMASGSSAFEDLGVSIRDANGNLRDNEDVFYEVIDALGKIENPTERDAKAMEIFGKSAQELNPLIDAGADKLKELGDEAESTGYVLSEDAVGDLTAVSDAFDRMDKAGENAKKNAVAAMAPAILSMTDIAVPAMQTFAQNFGAMFSGEMSVGDFTTYIMEQVNGAVEWINENLPTVMAIGTDIIVAILNGLAEGDIAGQAMSLVSTLQQGIADNLSTIMDAGVNLIISLITGLTEPSSLTNLITTGVNLLISLVGGIITAIPKLVQAVPTIVKNLVQALIQNAPTLILSGIALIGELTVGLIQAIPDIVASIPKIIKAIIDAFKEADWKSIGTNIMEGIKNGLKSMINSLVNTAKEIGGQILQGAKNILGIHSPSRVFRDEVGKMIPAGLEEGLDKAMPAAISDMEHQMDNLVIGASATLGGISGVSPVGQSVSNNYGGFVINVNAAEGQSANDIAEMVMYRIQQAVNRREAVFA